MIGWFAAAVAAPDRSAPPPVAEPVALAYAEPVVHRYGAVEVWYVAVPGSRKDAVHVVWRRGAADLNDGPIELSRAAGSLADQAAGPWSSRALAAWADLQGADVWSYMGQHETEVGFTAPHDAIGEAFDRAAAVATAPRFPARDLDQWAVDQELYYTSTGPASGESLAAAALGFAWFPADHPYGKRPSLAVLDALRPRDLRVAWSAWTATAPVILVAGGPWEDLEPQVAALAARLDGEAAAPGRALPVAPPAPRVIGVDLPGQDKVTISCRWPAPPSAHADTATMRALNMVLGGLFGSRLNLNLREEKGITYGASSTYRRDASWGALTVDVAVPADQSDVAMTEISREIEGLASSPPTSSELSAARRAIVGDWNRAFENADRAVDLLRQALYSERDLGEMRAELAQVQQVTSQDIARAAAVWFGPAAGRVCVLVGPRETVASDLHSIGIVADWLATDRAILGRF